MAELPPGYTLIDDAPDDTASGPLVVTVAPNRQQAATASLPEGYTLIGEEKPGILSDVVQSAGSGILKGAIGLAGLPGTVASGLRWVADQAADQTIGRAVNYAKTGSFDAPDLPPTTELMRKGSSVYFPGPDEAFSGKALTDYAAYVAPGIKYQPKTEAGKVAATIGEFTPGLLSPGSIATRVVGGVLAPALASEGLGRAAGAISPKLEPAGRFVGALAGGVGAALATRPSSAEAAVAAGMRGVDDATLTAAGQIMQGAQARGIALTWPEAIAQASNGGGRGLTNMQRVVEGSQGGGDVIGTFMAQRPGQIATAARREFDNLSPPLQAPSTIGPAIGEAAEQTARDARNVRSAQTRPFYERAAADEVPAENVNAVIAQLDEIISRAGTPELAGPAQQLRDRLIARQATPELPGAPATRTPVTDPSTGRVIRYDSTPATPEIPGAPAVPHTNVGRLDEVYGSARDQFTGPAPMANGTEARASRYAAEALEPLDTALRAASPALAEGRQVHQAVTRQFIEPLMQGPIGKLAERDLPTKKAIEVLFERNPLDGSAREIADTMAHLAARNRPAAQQIVRAHVATVFNKASRDLSGGANQFGGANFAAAVRGDPQQAQNLNAAIAGATSPQVAQGFNEFLNVLAATGQRARPGSATAFNQETQELLKKGSLIGEGVNLALTAGTKAPSKIRDVFQQWQMGRNTEQIARLFTNQTALAELRQLARAAPGSPRYISAATRLATIAAQASN